MLDQSDAFMSLPISAYSVRFSGIRWRHPVTKRQGALMAWRRVNFGMSISPAAQAEASVFLIRAAKAALVRTGLHCGPVADYDMRHPRNRPLAHGAHARARARRLAFAQKHAHVLAGLDDAAPTCTTSRTVVDSAGEGTRTKPSSKPSLGEAHVLREARRLRTAERKAARGPRSSCTALLSYSDDYWGAFSDHRSCWLGFLCLLWVGGVCGFVFSASKAQPPTQTPVYLAIRYDLRRFVKGLHRLRVKRITRQLRHVLDAGTTTLGDLQTVAGVLVWASAVIPAKPYYRIILDQINAHGAVVNGLWRRASKRTPVHVIDSLATDLKTWIMLLERLNGAPIEVGLRRLSSPFHCFSDASKHGIGWHIEGVGLFDAHPFPSSWLELHIMKESKYQTLFIGVLEAYACLHMLRRAIPTVGVNLQLPVHVDNLGLYYNLGGGRRQGAISSREGF